MQENTYDCLMGCASIGVGTVGCGNAAASLYNRLRDAHLAPLEDRMVPRCPLPLERLRNDLPVEPPPLIRGHPCAGGAALRRTCTGSRFQHRRPADCAADGQAQREVCQALCGTHGLNTATPFATGRHRAAGPLLRGWRWLRLALHFAQGIVTAGLIPFLPGATRRRLRRRWSADLLALLGVELQAAGAPIEPGCLLVANHISWLDVFVINALAPAAFVSKAEVRTWPIIGWLAARNETVFLRRGSRGHARIINAEIGALLDGGRNVAIFPEGTTTDGSHVLHFHAALLQPAIESGHPVQPLALSYHTQDGSRSRAPAYDGDVSLGECVATIIATPRLVARIEAAAPLVTGAGTNRRELARRARDAIVTAIECGGRQTPDTTPASPHGAEPAAAGLRIPA